jgi:hypothetical protein
MSMRRRRTGVALMAAGGVLAIVGLIGMLGSGDASTEAGPASSTPPTAATTTTASTTTVTATTMPTVTIIESTTTASTTTTALQPDPVEVIQTFVPEFAGMIAADDVEGLFDTLHPAALETQDADLCRAFIEREIVALGDYRLTGDVTGPVATTFGSTTVDLYTAPVSFTYQGQSFDSTATFALVDGQVRWFTTCR